MADARPILLHLTDLHFGWNAKSIAENDNRQLSQQTLLATLRELPFEWKPTIICLSGDIGYFGSKEDYALAKAWLDELLAVCGLGYDRVVVAAGNHDVVRDEATYFSRPNDVTTADTVLRVPIWAGFKKAFQPFLDFCAAAGIPPMHINGEPSWLVGERMVDGVRFVSLNSSWYCRDDHDKDNLWLGLPQLKNLATTGALASIYEAGTPLTVTLVHHPFEWLHEQEQLSYASRPSTRDFLAQRTHLILTGHTHARMSKVHQIAEAAYHFPCGAAYAGGQHPNGFRLIRLASEQFAYQAYEYDAGADTATWKLFSEAAVPRQTQESAAVAAPAASKKKALTPAGLREASADHARQLLEFKSRLLRPTGTLPEQATQRVSVHITLQAAVFNRRREVVTPEHAAVEMPLYEAVREARYSLLLGDLGSGKSTLAAGLVLATMAHAPQAVALLVPAKELRAHAPLSPVAVLAAVDRFVQEHISAAAGTQGVSDLLQAGTETLLVLDGLDEIDKTLAAQLLRYSALLTKVHATLQVVATARPVELTGVSFDEWKLIQTIPLQDPERLAILGNELLADGLNPAAAASQANNLLEKLKALPALNAVATTPLFVRLLYPKLAGIGPTGWLDGLTLGDLLFDVVAERLDRWGRRDEKAAAGAASSFQHQFTSPEAKAALLGRLARRSLQGSPVRATEAAGVLLGGITGAGDKFQVADEALHYLWGSGLATGTDTVEFIAQPLTEVLAAVTLAQEWASRAGDLPLPASEEWRTVAFAAGIARRWQLQERVRALLTAYNHQLLTASPAYLAAVATIATEFQDVACAQAAFDSLDGTHPGQMVYNYRENEPTGDAQGIAQLLLLAGQRGLEWLYATYLNPRNPLSNRGLALVEKVVQHWVNLLLHAPDRVNLSSLLGLIEPYKAAGSVLHLNLLPLLVLLFPDSFTLEERIRLLSSHLGGRELFQERAADELRAVARTDAREQVLTALLGRTREHGYVNFPAAALWLELSQATATALPPVIMEAAFEFAGSVPAAEAETGLAKEVRILLGASAWLQHARWALSGPRAEVAAGAAVALYHAGPASFWLLGEPLLRGINDIRRSHEAERILAELLLAEGEGAYQWLADQVIAADPKSATWKRGVEASWWRLLLPALAALPNAPRTLGAALRNLGIYTLPRYPEVREQFNQLLAGDQGESLQAGLRDQLAHPDPEMRWGAAAVLLAFDPQQEADALLVVVQAQEGVDDTSQGDWTQFCLSLSFGAEPLRRLREALPDLTPKGRAFALAILAARKMPLDLPAQTELFQSMLEPGNWLLNHYALDQAILANPAALPVLLETLDQESVATAERAASELLAHHDGALTLEQKAACLVRVVDAGRLEHEKEDLLARLRQEPSFAAAVDAAAARLEAKGSRPCLLRLLANAVADPTQWQAVVWYYFHGADDFRSIEDEDVIFLFKAGQTYPEYGQFIGEAARTLSTDHSRWQDHRLPETVQWLVLLADELLGGVPVEMLVAALQLSFVGPRGYFTYSTVAARALLARLPEIPAALYHAPWLPPSTVTEEPIAVEPEPVFQQLLDLARDAAAIPQRLAQVLQAAFFLPPYTGEQLQQISRAGAPGQLIGLTLRFGYGQPAKLADALSIFNGALTQRIPDNDKSIKQRLQRCWQLARREFLHQPGNEAGITAYLAALDQAFAEGVIWPTHLALELLRLRGCLLPEQVTVVLRSFGDYRAVVHASLYEKLCQWLAGEDVEHVRTHVVPVLKEVLNQLNQLSWTKSMERMGPEAYFLCSLAYWAFAEEPIPATQHVFLRGIKLLYAHLGTDKAADFTELMEASAPLLQLVPAHYFTAALQEGYNSMSPGVRQFCRLMMQFSVKP